MDYETLFADWAVLAIQFPSWSPSDLKELTPRERKNWLEVARKFKKTSGKN